MHRGFTHGLVGGVLVMPPLLAGLLWLLDRWQVQRGVAFKSGLPMRFGWLVALAYLATLTHPLFDLLTTYSVQLLSPFSSRWFHADALFIIDVWIWLLLGGSIAWSRIREEKGGRVAAAAAGGDRDHPRLHRAQPADHPARLCGGPRLGRRASDRRHLRVASASALLAPRTRVARGRLLPLEPVRPARRRLPAGVGVPGEPIARAAGSAKRSGAIRSFATSFAGRCCRWPRSSGRDARRQYRSATRAIGSSAAGRG